MLGREDDYFGLLERAHRAHLDAGEALPAVRCAFWIGANLARRGEVGRAGGWLARAQRLLDREDGERVEHGYMLIPLVFQHEASGDLDAATSTAGKAAAIGERFGDSNLFALAAHEQGHLLIQNGRVEEGLRLLDEAMVAVTAGELSPIVSGIVYCGVILACQEAYEVRRAQEWTAALTRWCERQPDLVAFTGRCLVHRAEIMQLHGSWTAALDEARQACRALRAGRERRRRWRRVLPAGGDPPPARRLRRSRGGLPGGERPRTRTAARARPAETRAGQRRRRGVGDPQGGGRELGNQHARGRPPRLCRDHARRGRPRRRSRGHRPVRFDRGGARGRNARGARRARARCGRAGLGQRRRGTGCAPRRWAGLAAARRALRGGPRTRADWSGLSGARRRGGGRART